MDDNCYQSECDADLSADGVRRRVAELGRQALNELADFKPLKKAERWALENIEMLEKKMATDVLRPPTGQDAPGREIRDHIRQQKSPIDFVMKRLSNPRVLAAVLSEEPFLSGLTDAELDVVRDKARRTLHPEQADMQDKLKKALSELREGVAATQRLVLERTDMRVDDDGQFRSVHEPSPRSKLMAVPPKASGAAASG